MSDDTKRFLLTMWDGGGTVPPELGVARRLVEHGHAVHILGDPTLGSGAAAAGCTFSAWQRAPHRTSQNPSQDILKDWEATNPLVMLRLVRDLFLVGPAEAFAADTAEAIARFQPDVVLSDYMLLGCIIAAQAARLPVVSIMPNVWMVPSKGSPAIGPGFPPAKGFAGRVRDAAMIAATNRLFKGGVKPLNEVRAAHALAPLTSFYDQILRTDRILVLTSAAFDFAAPTVPDNVRYIGPILDTPAWAEPWIDRPAPPSAPLVLVAFSSTYQQQAPVLQRIVDALATLPVRAVVTLGQQLPPGAIRGADNVLVVPSAPHDQILAEASLAITHCGHGTTMKALAAGVPMVCIPMGRDQNDTAARVVHHDAGVRLSPKASTANIRKAVEKVLADPRYRQGATLLARRLADENPTETLINELAELDALSPAPPYTG